MDPHSEIEEIASLFSERLQEAEQRTLAARQVMLEAIHTRLDLPLSDPPLSDDAVLSDSTLTDSTVAPPTTAPVPAVSRMTGTWRTPRDVHLRWVAGPTVDGHMTDDSASRRPAPTDEVVQPVGHPAVRSDRPSGVATPDQAALRSDERRSDRAFLWAVPLAGLVALATVSLVLLLL